MIAETAKVSRNQDDIQKAERPVPPRHPVYKWCSISAGLSHLMAITIRVMTMDQTRYGIISVSHRRATSTRSERRYGTKNNPDRIKNNGIRHMDSRLEPS